MIEPRMDEYMGARFEEICRAWAALYGQERLGVPARVVGKIWAADYDVDVAGELLDGRRLAAECKWWKKPAGLNVRGELEQSVAANRYYADRKPVYAIFARNGFTPELKAAESPELLLMTPGDLLGN